MEKSEYNCNPFVSRGRVSGIVYFLYSVLFSGLCSFLGTDFIVENPNPIVQPLAFVIVLLLVFPQLFILKKRLYDICLNNKISWILTSVIFILFIISFFIGLEIIALILFLLLLFMPQNETLLKLRKH